MNRRHFVTRTLAVAGGAALSRTTTPLHQARAGASLLADAHIDVLLDEPIATIAPEIYGHFVEHLGGVIYDGLWVGEDSKVPNVGGIRKALVDALAAIRPAVIRWPGGCFADAYDWRDGVGPREHRPRRTNMWLDQPEIAKLGNVVQKYEPNWFGTNEFVRFCRLVGAQPYFGANLRTLTAQAFHEWVEYCNAPAGSTTWTDVRAAGGDREPFGVKYWGVGNESWGCGGNFTPDEYATEFRRFATWSVPKYGVPLAFIGSGPSGADFEWTRRFFAKVNERGDMGRLWGWALHHYCNAANGESVAFDTTAWYDLLTSADKMDSLISSHWQLMRESDREHSVKLVIDEWGAWHKMTTNVDATHLFGQQSTVRDALVAALTLDTFNRHADKVAMANIAQLVNCIHSLFLTHEEKFLTTPTYHVFAMYAPHQGATSLRTVAAAPAIPWTDPQGKSRSFWGLGCSSSRREGAVTLTITNPHHAEPRDVEIVLRGASGVARAVRATTLTAGDIHAHNTFEQPRAVTPVTVEASVRGSSFVHRVPAASVTRLDITLGT